MYVVFISLLALALALFFHPDGKPMLTPLFI
jgi:hypothetical protein